MKNLTNNLAKKENIVSGKSQLVETFSKFVTNFVKFVTFIVNIVNILLTRNFTIDSDVGQWSHPLMIPLHCLWAKLNNGMSGQFECDVNWFCFCFNLFFSHARCGCCSIVYWWSWEWCAVCLKLDIQGQGGEKVLDVDGQGVGSIVFLMIFQ